MVVTRQSQGRGGRGGRGVRKTTDKDAIWSKAGHQRNRGRGAQGTQRKASGPAVGTQGPERAAKTRARAAASANAGKVVPQTRRRQEIEAEDIVGGGRRLMHKQPPRSKAPRGHYDVLGVARSATFTEVREGFRKQALATHPDKGGKQEDFRIVVMAFEILSDIKKRASYDADLDVRHCKDGLTGFAARALAPQVLSAEVAAEQSHSARGAARVVLTRLLATGHRTWESQLKVLDDAVLEALAMWLVSIANKVQLDKGPAERQSESVGVGPAVVLSGITCDKLGRYMVEVSWLGLKCRTMKTISLPEAIDWHIALTQIKTVAQARLRAFGPTFDEQEEASSSTAPRRRSTRALTRAAKAAGTNLEDSTSPLTPEELAQAYKMCPSMRLTFMAYCGFEKNRVITPSTQDLLLALKIKAQINKLIHSPTGADEKQREQVRKKKAEVIQIVMRERGDREAKEADILKAVGRELDRRGLKVPGVGLQSNPLIRQSALADARPHGLQVQPTARLEAQVALELRDALHLDHASACNAVARLRALSQATVASRMAFLLGDSIRRAIGDDDASELPLPKAPPTVFAPGGLEMPAGEPTAKRRRNAKSASSTEHLSFPAPQTPRPPVSTKMPYRRPAPTPGPATPRNLPDIADFMLVQLGQTNMPLRYLALPDWCTVRTLCRRSQKSVDSEMEHVCHTFTASEQLFSWEPRGRGGRGRAKKEASTALSRLTRFLACNQFLSLFFEINLSKMPAESLKDRQLQAALAHLPNVGHVIVPSNGWSSPDAKHKFVAALPLTAEIREQGVNG